MHIEHVKLDVPINAAEVVKQDLRRKFNLCDNTRIAGTTWKYLKLQAFSKKYKEFAWFKALSEEKIILLDALRAAQSLQGDMKELKPRSPNQGEITGGVLQQKAIRQYEATLEKYAALIALQDKAENLRHKIDGHYKDVHGKLNPHFYMGHLKY